MRFSTLLLFFLGLGPLVFSQPGADSLQAVWKNASYPDSIRFAALNKLANSSDSALFLYELLEEEAIAKKQPFWEVGALWGMANHHKKTEAYEKSLTIAEEGLKRSEETAELSWQGNFYLLMGLVYHSQNQKDTAIELMKTGIQILSQTSAEEDLQGGMNELAVVFHNHSQYDSAITYHRKTLQRIRESQNESQLVKTLYGLGIAYYQLNQDDSARHYYLAHLDMAEKVGDVQSMANVLVDLGQLAVFDGDYGAAMEHYQQGLSIARTHELVKPTGWLLQSIGVVYFAQQDLDQALTYFEEGLLSKEAEQDKFLQMDLLDVMGLSYKRKDSLDKALMYFQRGQAIAQEINNPFFLAKFPNRTGLVQHQRGEYQAAITEFSRSIEMYQEMKNPDGEANCWYRVGLAKEQLGDLSGAILAYERGLVLAQPLNAKPLLLRITKELHRCYRERNQFEQALATYDQYIELRDSLNSRKNQQATIKYEFETKALSDSLAFVQEKAASDLAYQRQLAQRNTFIVIGLALIALAFGIFRYRQQVRNRKREAELQRERERKEQLAELNALKSRFFANISHELRTPLTLILGPLSYLLDQPDAWDQAAVQRQLTLIQRNGKSLMQLVEEMLDLSKLEANQMEVEESETPLHPFFTRVFNSFAPSFQQKKIDFRLHWKLGESLVALVDQRKMEKVLNNYLSNALKFTPEGGAVDLIVQEVEGQLHLEVKDTGPGIPGEELPRLFDRFYQAPSGTLTNGGTGIGLGLVKEIAQLMDGKAYASSEPGKGSRFFFQLPLKKLAAKKVLAEVPKTVETVESARPISSDATILVVEDHADMRDFIQKLLSPYAGRMLLANNGREGLELLEQHGTEIDLIISDVMMPEMDGFSMVERIKASPDWAQLPVIMLTALASERSKLHALTLGVDDYLTKPFSTPELLARVQNQLHNVQQRKEYRQSVEFEAEQEAEAEAPLVTANDHAWLQEIQAQVESGLPDTKWSVEQLAEEVNLSPRQLRRRLKSITGLSPLKFIREVQLQVARRELEDGTFASLADLAYRCGFEQQGTFSTSFKKRFGKSPREYGRSKVA